MPRAVLFAEDMAHEEFLSALVARCAREHEVRVQVASLSVRGGFGRAIAELKQYLAEVARAVQPLPDLLIVATDANCHGLNTRRREIQEATEGYPGRVVRAIPDPHIERWLLLDSAAFKRALGRGCRAPDQKCERGRYKMRLMDAVIQAGVTPLLGGIEYARDLAEFIDLERVAGADASFGSFLAELQTALRELATRP